MSISRPLPPRSATIAQRKSTRFGTKSSALRTRTTTMSISRRSCGTSSTSCSSRGTNKSVSAIIMQIKIPQGFCHGLIRQYLRKRCNPDKEITPFSYLSRFLCIFPFYASIVSISGNIRPLKSVHSYMLQFSCNTDFLKKSGSRKSIVIQIHTVLWNCIAFFCSTTRICM